MQGSEEDEVHLSTELDELVTGADIARRFGVTTQRAHQLAAQPSFPKPLGRVGNYVVWRWSAVEKWGKERDKRVWVAEALAMVPRGNIVQSEFRMVLQAILTNALGPKPELPGASVAEVVRWAMKDLRGTPIFDPRLLELDWPATGDT